MPPGSKKRRAARRKQQQQQQHASDSQDSQPSSPHPQGNGGALHDSTDPSDDDRDSASMNGNGAAAEEVGVEFVDAADPAQPPEEVGVSGVSEARVSEPAEVRVSEPAEVRVSDPEEGAEISAATAAEVRVSEPAEVRVSEPEEVPGISAAAAAEVRVELVEPAAEASAMPAVHVDAVSEEVVQVLEDKAVLSEDVVDVVSVVEKPRDVGVAVDAGEESPRVEEARGVEGSEAAITEEVAPAPLIRRRAAWWDCCGLFDVVRGTGA